MTEQADCLALASLVGKRCTGSKDDEHLLNVAEKVNIIQQALHGILSLANGRCVHQGIG